MERIFITGDPHGEFYRIINFAEKMNTTTKDILIILGDVGLNYYLDGRDKRKKEELKNLNLTLFCIKGNHEKYPEDIEGYEIKEWHEGKVFIEPEYPNLIFAKDGEIYNFNNKKALVIGGAYSVDKYYRLMRGWNWFEDEQPSEETKRIIEEKIKNNNYIDYVLTHTCPYEQRPTHLFLSGIDQSKVDSSTEKWLSTIAEQINFEQWYFGHYHGNLRMNDKYTMLFDKIILLGD